MAPSEQERRRLFDRLESLLGLEETTTLMAHLPPGGWENVANDVFTLKADVAEIKADVAALKADVAAVKADVAGLADRMDLKMDSLEHKLTAAFRGELAAAITSQSRQMLFALISALAILATLAVTLTRLPVP